MINKFEGKYEFLSNFYHSEIIYDGILYPTVEHAFQAAKIFPFTKENEAIRKRISKLTTPGKAKYTGRSVHLREDWEDVKDDVMYTCVKEKFKIPELREKLLQTGDEMLVEGTTWHDNYWGDCSCPKCVHIQGRNQLGKTLMRVRQEIRGEMCDLLERW